MPREGECSTQMTPALTGGERSLGRVASLRRALPLPLPPSEHARRIRGPSADSSLTVGSWSAPGLQAFLFLKITFWTLEVIKPSFLKKYVLVNHFHLISLSNIYKTIYFRNECALNIVINTTNDRIILQSELNCGRRWYQVRKKGVYGKGSQEKLLMFCEKE